MTEVQQVITTLSSDIMAGLTLFAADLKMAPPEAASRIVTEFIAKRLTGEERERALAELDLLDQIEAIIDRAEAEDTWGEDVTSDVFEEVENNHLPLYTRAVGGDPHGSHNSHKGRINKRVGARVKARLGAEVVMRNGKRVKGQCSGRIILSWTKLRRSGFAG